MLNPGSAKIHDTSFLSEKPIQGEVILDPTMSMLIKIIEDNVNMNPIRGRLYIYNLFPLQNGNSGSALKVLRELWEKDEQMVEIFPMLEQELINIINAAPWVLIGWGCNNLKIINTRKRLWMDLLDKTGARKLGVKGKDELNYYHPRHVLKSKQIEYLNKIKSQFNELKK